MKKGEKLRRWSIEEIEIVKKYYPTGGTKKCMNFIDRSKSAIWHRARDLDILHTFDDRNHKRSRHIIKKISENRVIARCPTHGITLHYIHRYDYRKNFIWCSICSKEKNEKSKPISFEKRKEYERKHYLKRKRNFGYSLISRLRKSLWKYSKGKMQFSRDLSYSKDELIKHLGNIYKKQKGKCPMCNSSYEDIGFDIDHIIPLSVASNEEEIKKLFALENLSLLCPNCNQHIKKDRLMKYD